MTRHLFGAAVAAACLTFAACDSSKTPGTKPAEPNGDPVKVGTALFEPKEYRPAKADSLTADPVTVPMAHVVILNKLDMPSRVDGTVLWIGVEIPADEAAKLDPKDVYPHPRDKKTYRRLLPGDIVSRDQVIAILDDEQAFIEFQGASTKAAAAAKSAESYKTTVKRLAEIVKKTREGVQKGIVPEQELLNSQATEARYEADLVDHEGQAAVAASEAQKAKYVWDRHFLKPARDGEVQQVLKQPGEGVKGGQEPLLVIHDFENLRAVGNLPKEYVNVIARGDEAIIELAQDVAAGPTFGQHTTSRPIAAVAVGAVKGQPVIVSAGEDGRVYAWDRELKQLGSWRHPNGVRSLAVTPPEARAALALVGGVNGTATVYDLANPTAKGRDFEGRHDGGVAAAAFSPDGQFCVTADERAIHMYETTNFKRKYTFPREHHSAITSLNFTPQGRVVSAGREPWALVWQVGTEGAKVEHRIDSRSGDVTSLSVTDDGSRLLLDADKTRLDVMHLAELRKERPLVTAGEAGRFTTFAIWSPELDKKPDNRLIATTGGAEGVVQLWRAPTSEARGAEVARLMTRGAAGATCAAFSPLPDNGFVVVGTRKGDVHLWNLPKTTVQNSVPAKVTFVEPNIESSGRTVNVLVDFKNPKDGDKFQLRPGSAVTLVIWPKQ